MSDDELADKFRECAAWGRLPKPNAEKMVDLVFNLEKLKSIRELTRLLAIGAARARAEPQSQARHTKSRNHAHVKTTHHRPHARRRDRHRPGDQRQSCSPPARLNDQANVVVIGDRARARSRHPGRRRQAALHAPTRASTTSASRASDLPLRRPRQHRSRRASSAARLRAESGQAHRRHAEAHDRPRARGQARRHLLCTAQQGRHAPGRLEVPRRAPDVREAHRPQRLLRRDERDQGVQHLPRDLPRRAARGGQHDHARAHHRARYSSPHDTLRAAGHAKPRIGVAALNPHNGENGLFGDEEIRIIRPTVEKLRAAGHRLHRPDLVRRDLPQGAAAANSTAS